MSAVENNDRQGSWGSILLIYGIGVLGATTISQAITVARDVAAFFHAAQFSSAGARGGVEARISVPH